eukprot:CAMPEP_0115172744 /NCGR_PEP_ID=MMETSP0270-20121206/2972_1 /TAXON_ID=71861 /ORGANISM="Scrippsiella trochoidea, Strain CCMP3099" /LENGTH=99 /DNA_ID=CAMNT_0002585543 /DNA_START=492 /DNA_END=791 /DNA_ORIENTATION=+
MTSHVLEHYKQHLAELHAEAGGLESRQYQQEPAARRMSSWALGCQAARSDVRLHHHKQLLPELLAEAGGLESRHYQQELALTRALGRHAARRFVRHDHH